MTSEPRDLIPLREAVLCTGCDVLSRARNGHCPACGGPGVALVRLIRPMESNKGREHNERKLTDPSQAVRTG